VIKLTREEERKRGREEKREREERDLRERKKNEKEEKRKENVSVSEPNVCNPVVPHLHLIAPVKSLSYLSLLSIATSRNVPTLTCILSKQERKRKRKKNPVGQHGPNTQHQCDKDCQPLEDAIESLSRRLLLLHPSKSFVHPYPLFLSTFLSWVNPTERTQNFPEEWDFLIHVPYQLARLLAWTTSLYFV
jgi:hypothetical protein